MFNWVQRYYVYLFPALLIVFVVYYVYKYLLYTSKPRSILDLISSERRLTFPGIFPLEKWDTIPILVLTLIYGIVAFWNLGDNQNPQTFHRFTKQSPSIIVDIGEIQQVSTIVHYTGNFHADSGYTLETSADGTTWVKQDDLRQDHAKTFHWFFNKFENGPVEMRYLKITAQRTPMELGELVLLDTQGNRISSDAFEMSRGAQLLFDEWELMPKKSTYLNSTYFDEIYHARTAYEHLQGMRAYENTHPPLGKVLISIGISLFGMTPFGWRFIGTLFGVLMVPIMYIFIKNLFGKRITAILGTLLFAFDFMHYVQTRIATIDTYGVFFTILMYYFMYRFISTDFRDKPTKQLIPLALCGISFGLGIASKWTAFYAATGLVVLYVIYIVLQGRGSYREGLIRPFLKRLAIIVVVSVVFFVAIPAVIYYLSYIPYAKGMGEPLSLSLVWENQVSMFKYHAGVDAEHSYASRWWMWIFNIRPILYYLEYPAEGFRVSFGAFLNPAVCWGGLGAIMALFWRQISRRGDGLVLFILIGYAAQLVPWMFISRITFAYHYFPSMVFLVLALSYTINGLIKEPPLGKYYAYSLCGVAIALFVMFFPVLTGLTVPNWYGHMLLKWFPSWPF
jgi:dolichyl-phosphate-mannose-protein mannosyltransferase